jgi:hypothetical protein
MPSLFSSAARSLASRRCPGSSSLDEDVEGLLGFGLALLDKVSWNFCSLIDAIEIIR